LHGPLRDAGAGEATVTLTDLDDVRVFGQRLADLRPGSEQILAAMVPGEETRGNSALQH
jgi:hypothetical protein